MTSRRCNCQNNVHKTFDFSIYCRLLLAGLANDRSDCAIYHGLSQKSTIMRDVVNIWDKYCTIHYRQLSFSDIRQPVATFWQCPNHADKTKRSANATGHCSTNECCSSRVSPGILCTMAEVVNLNPSCQKSWRTLWRSTWTNTSFKWPSMPYVNVACWVVTGKLELDLFQTNLRQFDCGIESHVPDTGCQWEPTARKAIV